MASDIEWWKAFGSWFAIAFYIFLLEVANAFVVDLITQQQQQLRADQSIFDYIREPATKLADQIRALGEAASVIQRMLVPAHHTLFKDLLSATDFFDTEKSETDVSHLRPYSPQVSQLRGRKDYVAFHCRCNRKSASANTSNHSGR